MIKWLFTKSNVESKKWANNNVYKSNSVNFSIKKKNCNLKLYDYKINMMITDILCYKLKKSKNSKNSIHTPGHQTFWPWVVYYFSWSPAESTPKTEAKPRFLLVGAGIRNYKIKFYHTITAKKILNQKIFKN